MVGDKSADYGGAIRRREDGLRLAAGWRRVGGSDSYTRQGGAGLLELQPGREKGEKTSLVNSTGPPS